MNVNIGSTATSSMIVDLSGDNDNIGAITAANSIPKPSEDSPFERSCDNPECSAPKLISLVPKRETAEFITEPSVMNQPTLVNGFTTVFQVDGLAARMNDIMNGQFKDPTSSDGYGDPSQPKTVFRIVPNTHAHIVNYVVVDGAGETLRKIKSNDHDTMQKLLDSQRLSAEQMLKKLISKAFKTSARKPEPAVPLPIPSKVPGYTHLGVPIQNTAPSSATAPLPVPVSSLPTIPDGITLTPVATNQPQDSPLVINITPKDVPANKQLLKEKTKPVKTSKAVSNSAAAKTITTRDRVPVPIAPKPAPSATSNITPAKPIIPLNTSTPLVTSSTMQASNSPSGNLPAPKLTPQTDTPKSGATKPNILKRKQPPITTPELTKRLRPRSPKQKAPIAVGLEPTSTISLPTRKLPMLPKLPTKPPATANSPTQSSPLQKKESGTKSLLETVPPPKPKEPRTTEIAKGFASCSAEPQAPTSSEDKSPKVNPLFEPTTTSKALAATQNLKPNLAAKVNAALTTKTGVTKIGETVITPTSKSKDEKSQLTQTKPCSVSIPKADATNLSTKINEFLQKEAALKAATSATTSKATAASPSNVLITTISKITSTGPKVIARTRRNLDSVVQPGEEITPDTDPLALDEAEQNPQPTVHVTRSSKSLMSKSTPKEDDASSDKNQTLPTVSDTKEVSKSNPPPTMKTRASTPKVTTSSTPSNVKASNVSTPPATQTRGLRVVLPALKSGIMTLPVRSPHPNLKISSVISGGSAVAAATLKTTPKPAPTDPKISEIDKLQQELADLRRTVQRLSRKKS